jgi:UDP:flavonoid glycosyltransferase YjiC (YdhE family)
MRITIFTAGSQGDIQPCIMLGKGLQRAGFQVLVAAPQNFAELIQKNHLYFYPLRGDVQQIMSGKVGREFMETAGSNPVRSMLAMRKMIGPVAMRMAEDALEACRDADVLISLAVFAPLGKSIAEIRNIPLINVEPTPLLPTSAFPAAGWPLQKNLGGLLNRLSGSAMLRMIWQWYGPYVNEFRKRFRLVPLHSADFHQILRSTPLLGAYSPAVIPQPSDWSDEVHITGYWLPDIQSDWQPSYELQTFLDRGAPPVYVGFGSMGGRNPEDAARIVLQALEKSGQRGLLLTGWGGMNVMKVPDNVLVMTSAPHSWLFPRMAAVVHHGGAGTTAEGLRAGVPTVIVPFVVDQSFWGKRIKDLGLGPEPIPAKKLTADKLAVAIQTATCDPRIKERASAMGAVIRAENGVARAVAIVKQHVGEP